MKLESLKEGFNSMWDNVADGWRHLRGILQLLRIYIGGR